jgi:hypothetical protein
LPAGRDTGHLRDGRTPPRPSASRCAPVSYGPVPSIYSVRLVNIERSAGLIDDGRHDHRDPHRSPPWCPDPALSGAREPRAAAPTGRPPAHRAASTAANRRPPVLGPAVPSVERLDGCPLRRPTRHRHSLAAVRLQDLLDLEEPPARARPSGCRPGTAQESVSTCG